MSGGIWGLDNGFCLMVGGTPEAVATVQPIFDALAPAEGFAHVGPVGAGHFVKMVHNGIEYGLMQAYAEGFELMTAAPEFNLDLHQIAEVWRHGCVVRSWLLDLAERAFADTSRSTGSRRRRRLGRGALDGAGSRRPGRAAAGDHRSRCTTASRRAKPTHSRCACSPRCATSSAATPCARAHQTRSRSSSGGAGRHGRASGDLTARKLFPAIAELHAGGFLPHGFAIVGSARTEMTDAQFLSARLLEAVPPGGAQGRGWRSVVARSRYVTGEYHSPLTYIALGEVLREVDQTCATGGNRIFYLATTPEVFPMIVEHLGSAGLNHPTADGDFVRIVIEKPYGHDLKSAQALDATVHNSFDEQNVYRIDHYLGKETVQNVLALRFANAIFEPIWNRRYIDNVQITVAETLGVGHRAGFYESRTARCATSCRTT